MGHDLGHNKLNLNETSWKVNSEDPMEIVNTICLDKALQLCMQLISIHDSDWFVLLQSQLSLFLAVKLELPDASYSFLASYVATISISYCHLKRSMQPPHNLAARQPIWQHLLQLLSTIPPNANVTVSSSAERPTPNWSLARKRGACGKSMMSCIFTHVGLARGGTHILNQY